MLKVVSNSMDLRSDEYKKDFDERCAFYSNEAKGRKQTEFLKRCRRSYAGVGSDRIWDNYEKEWKIKVLEKYFPNITKSFIEYDERENESRIMREEARLRKKNNEDSVKENL